MADANNNVAVGNQTAIEWEILLVGVFAEDYLVAIGENKLNEVKEECGASVTTWTKCDTETSKCDTGTSNKDKIEMPTRWVNSEEGAKVLPFFICEKIDDFRNNGLKCPYEFVIERKDLFDGAGYAATELLKQRIAILKAQNGNGINIETFKDWMSGVMRKYLFLDDTAHGISGYIDPKDPNWDWSEWFKKEPEHTWWKARFSDGSADSHDPLGHLKPLMKMLWPEYFTDRELALAKWFDTCDNVAERDDNLNKIYNVNILRNDVAPSRRLPLSRGDRARFVTPTGKIQVLLIDDDAEKSVLLDDNTYDEYKKRIGQANSYVKETSTARQRELKRILARVDLESITGDEKNAKKAWREKDYEDAWRRFDQIFSVQPFELKPDDFPDFEKRLNEILKENLSYDFALVDLCFGEDPGRDPLGYHVIKKLSKLFPHMPIVVYSRYKDMGHIMRAFQCGAMWFLQKGDEQKLARHLMDVVKKGSWKREWRAMQEYRPVEFVYNGKEPSFDDKFRHTEEWQYLTAKSLEFFPGKFIEVKKMGGGISTASTFSVQKGLVLDGTPLQSPMIIKIDTAPNTRMEYERYFRYIRPYMANEAGRIEKPCIMIERNCSAIVYTFAGRQDEAHTLDSMKNMLKEDIVFKASCDYEKYRRAFDMIFDEILPKIHRVTPNREFGDGEENRHQDVFSKPAALDAKTSPGASFPNLQFGEVAKNDFYQTYLVRFPHFGKRDLSKAKFVGPPTFTIETKDQNSKRLKVALTNAHPYEFHDISANNKGGFDLEVYDYEHDRMPYFLTGDLATHVAKFRQQLHPGATLWVEDLANSGNNDGNNNEGKSKLPIIDETSYALFEEKLFGSNVDVCRSWTDCVFKYLKRDYGILFASCGETYFKLVEDVLRFCRALFGNASDSELKCYLHEQESLFEVAAAKEFFAHIKERFVCPVAICHGDLNYGNIMLESRKHAPKEDKPDVDHTVTDAWLIDFARTRRDLIAHDFNVIFTDTLGLMFDNRLFADKELGYDEKISRIMPRFVNDVMFAENSNPPDYLDGDGRFEFIYKILRRIRKAALASGMSEEMYALTTALECLMALKLHLKGKEKNIRASAALFAVAKICFEHICKTVELDLLKMEK